MRDPRIPDGGGAKISFKGAQFPRNVILFAVFFYIRYTVSYRDLEEIMAKRGIRVDHATLNPWVVKYSPLIASTARRRKAPADRSKRMDDTYIKLKGEWVYLYRAVDKFGREWTKHGGHAARFLFATVSRPSRTAALVTATR